MPLFHNGGDDESQFRFKNGAEDLIKKLVMGLPKDILYLNSPVSRIVSEGDSVEVTIQSHQSGEAKVVKAKCAVLAVPPLIAAKIEFSPPLAQEKKQAMTRTSTWMSDAYKVVIKCQTKFWNPRSLPPHFFDISNGADHALVMFDLLRDVPEEGKAEKMLCQSALRVLSRAYGEPIPECVLDCCVWPHKPFVHAGKGNLPSSRAPPDPLLRQRHGRVFFAGTECEPHGGHMEGAVRAGQRSAQEALRHLQ